MWFFLIKGLLLRLIPITRRNGMPHFLAAARFLNPIAPKMYKIARNALKGITCRISKIT